MLKASTVVAVMFMLVLAILASALATASRAQAAVAVAGAVHGPIAAAVVAFPDLCDYDLLLELDRCDSEYTCCMLPPPLCDPETCPTHPVEGRDPECCQNQLERCEQLAWMKWMCCKGELPPEVCALLPES